MGVVIKMTISHSTVEHFSIGKGTFRQSVFLFVKFTVGNRIFFI